MWYKTSNRKPYYDLKTSQRDFFAEHVRFIKESNTIESAFEKPYYDGQYNKMHLKSPRPQWLGGGPFGNPQSGCAFIQDPTADQEVLFSGGVVSPSLPSTNVGPFNIVRGSGPGTWYRTCIFCVSPECPGFGFNGDPEEGWFEVNLDNEEGKVTVSGAGACSGFGHCRGVIPANACDGKDQLDFDIVYTNEFCAHSSPSEPCKSKRTLPCDTCVDVETMTYTPVWTANNAPPSIARNSSTVVSFEGGKGPFTWTISSDHFFFDGAGTLTYTVTTSRAATVYADATACGPCFINIADNCGNSVDAYLLCTTNSGFLPMTAPIAGDGVATPVISPNCINTAFCMGATGAYVRTSTLLATNTTFYTSTKFTSPTLGDILIRTAQSIARQTSLLRYPYLCDPYNCSDSNCAPTCSSRNLDGSACYMTCADDHTYNARCSVCCSNAMSTMVTLNNSVCSTSTPYDCLTSCDAWGMERIQNYSSGNPVYLSVCLFPTTIARAYVAC